MKLKLLFLSLIIFLFASPCYPIGLAAVRGDSVEPETRIYLALPTPGLSLATVDTYIKAVKYGSGQVLSTEKANLSPFNGIAFVTNPDHDWRWMALLAPNVKVTITAGGKTLVGYPKAVGVAENVISGITDGDFSGSSWGVQPGWAETGGKGVATLAVVDALMYQDAAAGLAIWKLVYTITDYTSGSVNFYVGNNVSGDLFTERSGLGTFTEYKTRPSGSTGTWVIFVIKTALTSLSVDNAALGYLTAPNINGITITSTAGGTTYNWASDDGIDPAVVAATGATVTVTKN